MFLDKLSLNKCGIVKSVYCNPSIKRRLLDLGLVPGTIITPVFRSPLGEPTAYKFRNTVISIRQEDSCLIEVSEK